MDKKKDDEDRKFEVNSDARHADISEGLPARRDRVHPDLDHAPGGSISQGVSLPAAAL
jgi:hypothetical protein